MGDLPHLRLSQMTYREQSLAELFLGQLAQEVALIFVRVSALQNAPLG